jgi:hypothetical protein
MVLLSIPDHKFSWPKINEKIFGQQNFCSKVEYNQYQVDWVEVDTLD